jgi:hypothetical protein
VRLSASACGITGAHGVKGVVLLPQTSSVAGFVEGEEVTDCCTWWMHASIVSLGGK